MQNILGGYFYPRIFGMGVQNILGGDFYPRIFGNTHAISLYARQRAAVDLILCYDFLQPHEPWLLVRDSPELATVDAS